MVRSLVCLAMAVAIATGCLYNWIASAAPASTIKIGALYAWNTTIGTVAQRTIQLAIDNINGNESMLRGAQLQLVARDTGCLPVQGASAALELMTENVVAVVGPQSSSVSHFVSHIGASANVPIVTFAATEPNLSQTQYSFLSRTAPSDAVQMEALAALIANFGWKVVAVIYTDDDYGANGISALTLSLQNIQTRIVNRAVLPPNVRSEHIHEQLNNLQNSESRVFVLHVQQELGLNILKEAYNLSMIENGYAWLVTDLVANELIRPDQDSQLLLSLRGVLGIRRHIYPSTEFGNLLTQLQVKYPSDMKSLSSENINAYGLYAYDAVYSIAYAISQQLEEGYNLSFTKPRNFSGEFSELEFLEGGSMLMKKVTEAKFHGASGFIHFDEVGDIKDPVFEYINIVGKNAEVVGFWGNQTGISKTPPSLLINDTFAVNSTSNATKLTILWPGGSNTSPQGWALPRNGKALKIGVPLKAGFEEVLSKTVDANNITKYDGLCIRVFETAITRLGYAVTYDYVPITSTIPGKVNPDYNLLVDRVARKELDAAVGDITITADRLKKVDFTQPFIESGLVVLVPRKGKHERKKLAFLRPYTAAMWGAIFGFTLLVGLVIKILEREEFKEHGVMRALLFSFATLFSAHREDTRTFLGRIVLLCWLFVVLIVNSSYTASLTAILTVEELTPDIQGLDSLLKSKLNIGFQTGSFAEKYLRDLNVGEERLKDYASIDSFRMAFENHSIAAVVDERPYVDMFLETNCDKFVIAGSEFTKSGWGFVFPRGSEIVEDLSEAIVKMSQTGELSQLQHFWLKDACQQSGSNIEAVATHLDIDSFWFLFTLMACVLGGAILVHLCIARIKRSKPELFLKFEARLRRSTTIRLPSSRRRTRNPRGQVSDSQ